MAKSKMRKVGAFWLKESEAAGKFMSGQIDVPVPIIIGPDDRLMLFRNKSESENSPDYDLMVAPSLPKAENAESSLDGSDNDDVPF